MKAQKHLLVIRLSSMGDVAMTVPVISALVHQNPNIKVTILTQSLFAPLFQQLPNVSIHIAGIKGKHKGVYGLWKLFKELKALKIDAVADVHNVLRSNVLKVFFKFLRIEFAQINKGRKEKKALIAQENKVFMQLQSTHERYADVFRELNCSIDLNKTTLFSKQTLAKKTLQLIDTTNQNLIGIAPFAAFKGKTYPIDLMEKVVADLSKTNSYKILFFGGGNREKEQLDIWESQFENTVNTIGKFTFSEELELISNLDLMLAMDSGNAHIASLYSVPTVTLWGVTHPYAGFYPFGQAIENSLLANRTEFPLIPTSIYGNKTPAGYEQVMRSIQPNTVVEKVKSILENK